MKKDILKKAAILTSGGDASSMNKVLSTFVKYAISKNIEPYFVYEGYYGLYHNKIKKVSLKDVNGIYNLPGTIIRSARFPEFANQEYRKKAADNLKKMGIDTLFVCGGNGSYIGAWKLKDEGINVICLPGTIDNDIACTDLTIGFDTSLNTICQAINQIKVTSDSHKYVSIVELMGKDCPDLTIWASTICEVDSIITYKHILDKDEFTKLVKDIRKTNKEGIVILVTERLYGMNDNATLKEVAKYIESKTGESVKLNVLGYLQRAGTPTAMDLQIATRLTIFAIDSWLEGKKNITVGIKNFKEVSTDIDKAVKMKVKPNYELVDKLIYLK